MVFFFLGLNHWCIKLFSMIHVYDELLLFNVLFFSFVFYTVFSYLNYFNSDNKKCMPLIQLPNNNYVQIVMPLYTFMNTYCIFIVDWIDCTKILTVNNDDYMKKTYSLFFPFSLNKLLIWILYTFLYLNNPIFNLADQLNN